jgi:hypothetical protein
MKPELDFMCFCDMYLPGYGKDSMIGLWTQIFAPKLPCQHREFTIAAQWYYSPLFKKKVSLGMTIKDPRENDLVKGEAAIEGVIEGDIVRAVFPIKDLIMKEYGHYEVCFAIDSDYFYKKSFELKMPRIINGPKLVA